MNDAERWAAAATFSHRATLDPVETVLWRAERHPVLSGTSCVVILLDREPDWARFRAAHEWGTRLVTRLRQRILEPALPTTSPAWVTDEDFDIDHHLHRRRIDGEAERADVLRLAQDIALTPLDRSRPLWEGTLLTGLSGGGAAYVLKIHHALADTRGSVQLLSMLQSRTRRHTPDKPSASSVGVRGAAGSVPADAAGSAAASRTRAGNAGAAPASATKGAGELALQGLVGGLGALPGKALTATRMGVFAALNPGEVLAEGMRYAASVRRLFAPSPAPASPLFDGRDSRTWRFVAIDASGVELAAAARVAGASTQDAFLAAVLGGLARYHSLHGVPVADVPVKIAVSVDRADDPMSGNRFAGAMIAAPADMLDPTDRIAAVRGEILSLHVEPALDAFRAAAPLASRFPSDLVAALLEGGAVADVSLAMNAGPTRTSYMAGARVDAMYCFGPLPGVAISASLLTYRDAACIGVNVDGAAVHDVEALRACLVEGLEEVLALGR